MRLEHHLVGGYVRYISPHIIIIIIIIIEQNTSHNTSSTVHSFYALLAGSQENLLSRYFW